MDYEKMKIIHRFVLSSYLFSFFSFFVFFVGFFVLVELFELKNNYDLSTESLQNLFNYIMARIPFLAYVSAPVAIILSTIFVIASRAHLSEIIASQAGGISLLDYGKGIVAFTVSISLLLMLGAEFIVPEYSDKADFIRKVLIQKKAPPKIEIYDFVFFENKKYIFADYFSPDEKIMDSVSIIFPDTAGSSVMNISFYDRIKYADGIGWLSSNRTEAINISPPKAIELTVSSQGLKIILNKSIETIKLSDLFKEVYELKEILQTNPSLDKMRTEIEIRRAKIQSKLAFPISIPFIAIFCIGIGARIGRRKGLGFAIGSALVCTLLYMIILQSTIRLSELAAGLPEFHKIAVFIPWIMPLIIAFMAMNSIRSPMPRWLKIMIGM